MDPHITKEGRKHYAKGLCRNCYMRNTQRKYRALNPEKDRERKRKWYQVHKKEFCEVRRKSRILKKYSLSIEEYEELKTKQQGKCLICNEERILVLDHNHKTGIIRGMLCDSCNRGLGYFRDNPEILMNAIKYLLDKDNKEVIFSGS